jgi:hypothetical protein
MGVVVAIISITVIGIVVLFLFGYLDMFVNWICKMKDKKHG